MSQQQVEQTYKVHALLEKAHRDWPNDPWERGDYYAIYLNQLFARTIGDRPMLLASARIEGERTRATRYEAVIFTKDLIFSGSIAIPRSEDGGPPGYPEAGNVTVIPRSKITAVTLHSIDNDPATVAFSVSIDGHPPVVFPRPRWNETEAQSQLLDEIIEELATRQ